MLRTLMIILAIQNPCIKKEFAEDTDEVEDTGGTEDDFEPKKETDRDARQDLREYAQSSMEECKSFPCESSSHEMADLLDPGASGIQTIEWRTENQYRLYLNPTKTRWKEFTWETNQLLLKRICENTDCSTKTVYPAGVQWLPRYWQRGTESSHNDVVPVERYQNNLIVGRGTVQVWSTVHYWVDLELPGRDKTVLTLHTDNFVVTLWDDFLDYDSADNSQILERYFYARDDPYAGIVESSGGPLVDGDIEYDTENAWHYRWSGPTP